MHKLILTFAFIGFSIQTLASDYLEVIVNPANVKLDWSTPATLSHTYLSSAIKASAAEIFGSEAVRSTVGHVMIHFNCTGRDGKVNDFYTGMSGQEDQFKSMRQLLVDQSGLSVLFSPVDDGYIETDDEVRGLIYSHYARKDRQKNAPTIVKENKFIRFKVSPTQCDQALEVEEAYKSVSYEEAKENLKKLPPQEKLYFGFALDAYGSYLKHKEDETSPLGGVCSSFAVAILKAAGVFDPALDMFWKRSVEASVDLLGGLNVTTGKNYRITLSELLTHKNSHWITEGIETKSVVIYEPELIWNFIAGVQSCQALTDANESATANLCTPELKNWISSQKAQLQTKAVSSITATIEEDVLISGPKAQSPQYHTYEKEMTRELNGIAL